VDENQNYHQSISVQDARRMAQDAGKDLVCFNKPGKKEIALCKIIDFGKWKYYNDKQKKKKGNTGKKNTKEVRFSPNISDHDIEHKLKHVMEFIEDGDDVLFSMRLKGRERAHFGNAEERMNDIVAMCSEYCSEISRRKSSNMIIVRVGSNKKEAK
jgi:translation initiation factor IF-3